MKRARRKPRMSRLQREHLAAFLHLLADGPRDEIVNPFLAIRFGSEPERFAALWEEHGEGIAERWREAGHQPSPWWRWMAGRAGVAVPKVAA